MKQMETDTTLARSLIRKASIIFLAGCVSFPMLNFAQNDRSESAEVEEVYVTAKRPGPALWQVTNGDNVLYIFGSLQPLPEDFEWDSARVEWTVSQSQVFITPPRARTESISLLNPFKAISVSRKLLSLRKLPEDQRLSDVIPASLYEEVLAAKQQYSPENQDIDELRPFFVAETLMIGALNYFGLADRSFVLEELQKTARRHKVPITNTQIEIPIQIALESLELTSMETEIACLETTLASIASGMQSNIQRAQAWANGNKAKLMEFNYPPRRANCLEAVFTLEETSQESNRKWINAVTTALETNQSSITVLPIHELARPDGLLAELRNLGYSVKEAQ